MTDEKINPEITEEATDPLGVPDSQEESNDWSDDLSPEKRAAYDTAVNAVDEFIANHPTYKPTDENRQAILDYLDEHALAISRGSLELAWEQIGDRLDLAESQKPESQDQELSDEQPDASARLATAGLAQPKPEEPKTARGKKPTAWRNGKEIEVGA